MARNLRPRDFNVTVEWKDDYRPTAIPDGTRGVLFMVKGKQAWVTWPGQSSPSVVFAPALVVVK